MRKEVAVFIILSFLMSAQAWANKLIIKSQPDGADIFIMDGNSRPVALGKTPYEGGLDEIINNYVKSSSFVLELKKAGHETYRVLLAKTSSVDMSLSANLELSKAISNIKEHDLLMNELFDVQKLIRSRNFKDAISKLESLEEKNQGLSIIPELRATAMYLNKDVEGALSYYRKAFALNPDNADAYRMKTYLEKKLGVDSEMK
jgi:tetratricopeptide (TPR) repeat protein